MKTKTPLLVSFTALVVLTGCAELNDPYYPYPSSYPSRDPYGSYGGYGGGYGDPYYGGYRHEQRELERERRRVREERKRLEEERERAEERRRDHHHKPHHVPPPPPPPRHDECPSGFHPSDRKCTDAERKRGCKDLRNSSGQLCVHR